MNSSSWNLLSSESQTELKNLLPPTAFRDYQPTLEPEHPSAVNSMVVDQSTRSDTLDTSVFTDPHFLAAAHTFQDHLYSNWLSDAHAEKVKQFEAGTRDGTLAAPWKDESWEKDNKATVSAKTEKGVASTSSMMDFTKAGYEELILLLDVDLTSWNSEAAEVRLATLARKGVIRVGDVISYKRHFSNADLTIEKDVIVCHSLTLWFTFSEISIDPIHTP